MSNELNLAAREIGANIEVNPPRTVVVYESPEQEPLGFAPVLEAISHDPGPVMYVGDGTASSAEEDLKILPAGTEVVGLGTGRDKVSSLRGIWARAGRQAEISYIYADANNPPKKGSAKYIILQETMNMSAETLHSLYFMSLEALETGGHLFRRNENGEWEMLRKVHEEGRPQFRKITS
jgi:hypothetical protein